jgi:hypothetical protein
VDDAATACDACAPALRAVQRGSSPSGELPRDVSVTLAPLDWVDARLEADGEQAFIRGCSVGHLAQSGGYRFDEALRTTRSTTVAVHDPQRYRELTAAQLDEAFSALARERKWRVQGEPPSRELTRAAWSVDTGPVEPGEGTDNVHVTPLRVKWSPLAGGLQGDLVAVPVAIHAYSHNAGWFPGQAWGCPAGARVRLAVGLYDARTGRLLSAVDVDAPVLDAGGPKHPDRYQAEALLQRALGLWREAFVTATGR